MVDFDKIRNTSENFRNELPAFEEQVPEYNNVIYDPSTDPVFEAHALLNKGEYPQNYYALHERWAED